MKFRLLLVFLALTRLSVAMDGPVLSNTGLEALPRDVIGLIFQELTKAESLVQAIATIKSLGATSRRFAVLLSNPLLNRLLIERLIKKFPRETHTNYFFAAHALNTPGSRAFLKDFIQSHPAQALKQVTDNYEYFDFNFLKELVSYGANVNLANSSGAAPLIKAIEDENVLLVNDLLSVGANPIITDEDGDSALAIAQTFFNLSISPERKNKYKQIIALLKMHGARS